MQRGQSLKMESLTISYQREKHYPNLQQVDIRTLKNWFDNWNLILMTGKKQ